MKAILFTGDSIRSSKTIDFKLDLDVDEVVLRGEGFPPERKD